jgi:hypothetical protein
MAPSLRVTLKAEQSDDAEDTLDPPVRFAKTKG